MPSPHTMMYCILNNQVYYNKACSPGLVSVVVVGKALILEYTQFV